MNHFFYRRHYKICYLMVSKICFLKIKNNNKIEFISKSIFKSLQYFYTSAILHFRSSTLPLFCTSALFWFCYNIRNNSLRERTDVLMPINFYLRLFKSKIPLIVVVSAKSFRIAPKFLLTKGFAVLQK